MTLQKSRPRILLVDDAPEQRTMLGLTLADEGKNCFESIVELRRLNSTTRFIATANTCWLPPEPFLQMARQLGAISALPKPVHMMNCSKPSKRSGEYLIHFKDWI